MHRPPLEVADLLHVAGQRFIERSRSWLTAQHRKVLAAIERCRTAALGGPRDVCSRCGYRAVSYNSCRNRHCPKCQAQARDRWMEARREELLPTRYVHVVFTLPHLLAPLALQNKKVLYDLLLSASAQTLLEIARRPRHLGAEIGFFSVLHGNSNPRPLLSIPKTMTARNSVMMRKGAAHQRLSRILRGFLACCNVVHFPAAATLLRHNLRHKMDCDVGGD
jgi:predicted Zn-ribbon and HTH transcriptional regulator